MLDIYKYLPNNNIIDWELIENTILKPFIDSLKKTNQEYNYHQEGNVYIHTKMVCEELINLNEYQELNKEQQLELFLASLFHDIGKTVTTKIEDGKIISPHHGVTGSLMVREYLYTDFKLGGNTNLQRIRETICLLIKYHSFPLYIYDDEKKIIKLSLNQELTKDFNIKMLCLLSKADILGRIGPDKDTNIDKIEYCILKAKELNCYETAFKFKNNHTKIKYLNSNHIWHYQELYDDSNMEVILLSGLPGTGKDTYIKKHFPHLPVISLDDLREELKVNPEDEQGTIYNLAKEKAKEYLRNKQPFIWNATNLTNLIRQKQIKLFHDYYARVRIIYLETSYEEVLIRNSSRSRIVPEVVINKMLRNLNIPENDEAEIVEWIIV